MRTRNWLMAIGAAGALVLAWALLKLRSDPPEVQLGRAMRETIHSSITTNGKVEPIEWAVARAERSGPVIKMMVHRGEHVEKDQELLEIDASEARAALVNAQARMAAARSDLNIIERGGRATDLAEIASGLEKAHHDLQVAEDEYARAQRLEAAKAGTHMESIAAKQKADAAQLNIDAFEARKTALAATGDHSAAQARLNDAQAAGELAQTQIRQSVVRAPIGGTVYQFDLKPGAYLNAGDQIASIGRLDRVRVTVYVDEPDLGHVKVGMPVAITWDALAGREWPGEVDRMPTQVIALGTRQVGEVACVIQNPDGGLLPGTNVTVEIRSDTASNALTIPKEALRSDNGQSGVYTLAGSQLAWKPVKAGLANTTRVEVQGLEDGAAVALFSEKPLHDSEIVKPVFARP